MGALVSIVVPVYNAHKYLYRCVKSITDQTYKNLEIILVDDGSHDNSPKLCDKWAEKDSRIKAVHQKNMGAGIARNTGLNNATGEYILFVDSDDYLSETAVDECVSNAKEHNSDAVIFAQTIFHDDKSDRVIKLTAPKEEFEREAVRNELLPKMFTYGMDIGISVWAKMFKLNIIAENNIRFLSEREYYSEDALFVLEYFSKINKATVINKNMYFYYSNDNSLSKTYQEDREKKLNNFLQQALKITERENLPKTVNTHIIARYHGNAMVRFKQIASSQLTRRQKAKALKAQYENEIFRSTLSKDVLKLEKKSLRFFYTLVKFRCYFLSNLLLLYRVSK